MELTEQLVYEYRNLYYDFYKRLVTKYPSDSRELRREFETNSYGWTWRKFEFYKSVDFAQRLVFEYGHVYNQMNRPSPTMREEYKQYDPNLGALRLKCPLRTEDPDQFN